MAKTNYTRVEEALAEGLRKMEMNRLLIIADTVSGKQPPSSHQEHTQFLKMLHHDLRNLQKAGKDPFEKGNFDKDEILKYLKDPTSISEEGWKKIEDFKKHITILKGEKKEDDEKLIEEQRKSQKTKRFNIKDKWIPLT